MMRGILSFIIAGWVCLGFSVTGFSQTQNLQFFGPGVHEDLDHRIQTRSICIPNPKQDLTYNFNISFAENVNQAIRKERTLFGQSRIADYVHPDHYTDPVDYAHKIITAIRKAYAAAYDIEVIDIPLDTAVIYAAQNHSCGMINCGQFTHSSSCTGSPLDRLSAQVGNWGNCLTGYSENIALNTSESIEGAIEWAVFGMMYADIACCANGHRENFLKCTYDQNWKMGFGYQKGKYNYGSGRSYDSWYMTWDYAKRGQNTACKNIKPQGNLTCPKNQNTTFALIDLSGKNNCSDLTVFWSMGEIYRLKNFEVFVKKDDGKFNRATVVPFTPNKKDYEVTIPLTGNKVELYVRANTDFGDFKASAPEIFDLQNCTVSQPEEANPDDKPDTPAPSKPNEDVTDNTPPKNTPEDNKPETEESEKEIPGQVVVYPNPAGNEIQLKNVPYGSVFFVYNINGRLIGLGIYSGKIILTGLTAGQYVIIVNGQAAQFVKS